MLDIIVWGIGDDYNKIKGLLSALEQEKDIKIIAYTGNEKLKNIDGVPYIDKEEIKDMVYDFILITTIAYFGTAKDEARYVYGIDSDKIIGTRTLLIDGFTFHKYKRLLDCKPTFISNNCTAGVIYNMLGWQFTSPIINMFIMGNEYLRLIKNLRQNLDSDIVLKDVRYDKGTKIQYPVYELESSNISLYMNHYSDFEIAKQKWMERKERINYDNIIYIFSTELEKEVSEFMELDIGQKICFTPSNRQAYTKNVVSIDTSMDGEHPFWYYVQGSLRGRYPIYDVFDLLLRQNVSYHIEYGN